ncbi:S10 family peptidase [Salinispira pacifica]|uniref:Carboxypeptidase-related protein n=1 Tax=Salinispira pacifica TaxID=1307761 RepID=V5WED7_9SPIO|nr:carboxypeptidase-related protein [Salinispira pacifica]AHC14173.1 carboxypeptidase-related protein [Salinispira pacifica]
MPDTTNEKDTRKTDGDYTPPGGSSMDHRISLGGETMDYSASADWMVLRKKDKPAAEMFHISYVKKDGGDRPITFVFNGGPGASSVFLHLGAMGPRRARFNADGTAPPPPHSLMDNADSWLEFTDLVFIDPIGTGLSRPVDEKEGKTGNGGNGKTDDSQSGASGDDSSEYWQLKRDLESLGEFISKYLSRHRRWESPVYIAGESYGGFRTAKLTRMLQQDFGVGLSGAIIISPAMEFTLLDGSDYDVLMWLDTFPTMAAAAHVHGKSRKKREGEDLRSYMQRAADFALKDLLPVLAAGDMYGEQKKKRVLRLASDYLGLSRDTVVKKNGRVDIRYFVKNLLRDQGLHLGLYDASLKVRDPYPDRDEYTGPDPTLHNVDRVFAAGINTQLRKHIGLETERDYTILSMDVNSKWKIDTRKHALQSQVGATDDLRYGMSLNPDMKVFLCHGIFDLVTPYFAAERISNLMKLGKDQKRQLQVKHYDGGHMFYTWESSRHQFYLDMKDLYSRNSEE